MATMIVELETSPEYSFIEITTGKKTMTVSLTGQLLTTRMTTGKARLGVGKPFYGPNAIREALDSYKSADAKEMLLLAKAALGL